MSTTLLSPSDLSKPLAGDKGDKVPSYDWETQERYDIVAGSYTANSIQTFNSKGEPSDSRSDRNDG